jgi:hypothetical protein
MQGSSLSCRDGRELNAPPIGLSTIVEEKDLVEACEHPTFVDGTPAAVLKPLGRLGSMKVIIKKPAALSAERRRLEHVLEFIGGEQLRERLSEAVRSEDEMVENLAALLPEAMFPGKVSELFRMNDWPSGSRTCNLEILDHGHLLLIGH